MPRLLRVAIPFAIIFAFLAQSNEALALLIEDFNTDDGGFTVFSTGPVENPWVYSSSTGSWLTNGTENQGTPTSSALTSPEITVLGAGLVTMSFSHRYSFEYDTTRWDGGQVRLSVNAGPYLPVPGSAFSANGYVGTIEGNNALTGQEGFNGDSPDYYLGQFIVSELDLGTFQNGDKLSVQFLGAWDEYAKGSEPNWQIDRVEVTSPIPEPASLVLLALGGVGFAVRRRRPR